MKKKYLIVVADYYQEISKGLLNNAIKLIPKLSSVKIIKVPGVFEIPGTVEKLKNKNYNAIICIGAIIKGETDHYHYISDSVSNGIMNLSTYSKIPIIFGVLTCQNIDYAKKRSSKDLSKNKGYEVGKATIEMIKVFNENNLS